MSDSISVDEIKRKIRDGVLKTCQPDASKTELWKFFLAIEQGRSLETLVLVSRCLEDMKNGLGLGLEIKVFVLVLVLKKKSWS